LYREKYIFFKKTLFLKSKYHPTRIESSNRYKFDDFNINLTSIRCLIDDHFLLDNFLLDNNLFIKNKIDCMFLKIIYNIHTEMMCFNYTKYLKSKQKLEIVLFECSKIIYNIHTDEKFSF